MIRRTITLLAFLLGKILATACAPPNAPAFTPTPVSEIARTDFPTVSPTQTRTQTLSFSPTPLPPFTPSPTLSPSPTALVESQPSTELLTPLFAPALSGGEAGGMYPEQDLSIIAYTGHIQFLNVFANW